MSLAGLGTGLQDRELRTRPGDRENFTRAVWRRTLLFLANNCYYVPGYEQGTSEHDHQILLHYGWFETTKADQTHKSGEGYKTFALNGRYYWFPDRPRRARP